MFMFLCLSFFSEKEERVQGSEEGVCLYDQKSAAVMEGSNYCTRTPVLRTPIELIISFEIYGNCSSQAALIILSVIFFSPFALKKG